MKAIMAVSDMVGIFVGGRADGRCKGRFWEWAEAVDRCRRQRVISWEGMIAQAVSGREAYVAD